MKNIYKKLLLFFSLILYITFNILPANNVFAQTYDFEVIEKSHVIYNQENDYTTVNLSYTKKVYNSQFFYPKGSEIKFYLYDRNPEEKTTERKFKKKSISVKSDKGKKLKHTIQEKENYIIVQVKQDRDIYKGKDYTVKLSYKTHEYLEKIGNIIKIYFDSYIKEDNQDYFKYQDKSSNTWVKRSYLSQITVPNDLAKELSLKFPSLIEEEKKENNITYSLKNENVFIGTAYLLFGDTQYVEFSINWETPKTDDRNLRGLDKYTNLLSTNIYKVNLPRDFDETNQKVLYKRITPEPTELHISQDGNMSLQFEIPANKRSNISIEGYILSELKEEKTEDTMNIKINEYLKSIPKKHDEYLKTTKYWQSDSELIKKESNAILQGLDQNKDSIYTLLKKDYDFVTESLDYNEESLKNINDLKRQGAEGALISGTGVCMEYADLMIAILRAQGIPARGAVGYGTSDYHMKLTYPDSDQIITHQWVQVWIPNHGWISIDPTWGDESNRYYIGPSLEHVLWHTITPDNIEISDHIVYTADSVSSDKLYKNLKIQIDPITKKEFSENNKDLYDFKKKFNEVEIYHEPIEDKFSDIFLFILKTTPIGRIFITIAPICCGFPIILISTALACFILIKTIKKRRANKKS